MTPSLDQSEKNGEIARRIIWFESPKTALANLPRFIAYACRYASHEDMKHIRAQLGDEQFMRMLDKAPPGVIDARSWHYWNLRLGRTPPPPMPKRKLKECE
ncbi:MAG: hypothetical protein OXR62_15925 [Ahrensia sp.]|nr:hypothetical protein [Ahrensia sp.]